MGRAASQGGWRRGRGEEGAPPTQTHTHTPPCLQPQTPAALEQEGIVFCVHDFLSLPSAHIQCGAVT